MNFSAILVAVPLKRLSSTARLLERLPGVSVHHTDPSTGRMIVIQEAETIELEMEGLKQIQELPGIIMAELVQHHFEDDSQIIQFALEQETDSSVPERLND